MAGRVWRVFTNGPGWEDVRTYMQEIENTHDCNVSFLLSADGAHSGPGISVVAVAAVPDLESVPWGASVSVRGLWPSNVAKTMESLCFFLLFQLDNEAGQKLWHQNKLPLGS